jgi:hypothetical protein
MKKRQWLKIKLVKAGDAGRRGVAYRNNENGAGAANLKNGAIISVKAKMAHQKAYRKLGDHGENNGVINVTGKKIAAKNGGISVMAASGGMASSSHQRKSGKAWKSAR